MRKSVPGFACRKAGGCYLSSKIRKLGSKPACSPYSLHPQRRSVSAHGRKSILPSQRSDATNNLMRLQRRMCFPPTCFARARGWWWQGGPKQSDANAVEGADRHLEVTVQVHSQH
eukprot:3428051-Rhodomonas_salina.3